jgi:hypothetical protein
MFTMSKKLTSLLEFSRTRQTGSPSQLMKIESAVADVADQPL